MILSLRVHVNKSHLQKSTSTLGYVYLKIRGTFMGVPLKKVYDILGSVSGSPYLRKLPFFMPRVFARLPAIDQKDSLIAFDVFPQTNFLL